MTFVDLATERAKGPAVRVGANPITWIAFSLDGSTIVTSDLGYTARLVDVATHQLVGPVLPLDPFTGPVFSREQQDPRHVDARGRRAPSRSTPWCGVTRPAGSPAGT